MPEITKAHVDLYLEQIRALIGIPQDAETERQIVTEFFPGFLAAVEAVLALHVPAVVLGAGLKGGRFDYCETCSGHPAWPCPEVQAISGALLGEGETDGH